MTDPSTALEPRPHTLPAGLTASQEAALIRDGYACAACGDHTVNGDWGFWNRTRREPQTPANVIVACNTCITDFVDNRPLAIRLGYVVPDKHNPTTVPIVHARHGRSVLTAAGQWAKADRYTADDWEAMWPA